MHWICCDIAEFSGKELESIYSQLSPSRKQYLDRLRREEDKKRSLAATALVNKLLQEYGNNCTATLQRRSNGQPYFSECDLHVSISHCGPKVACAIGTEPVGIDIEQIRPMDLAICRYVCVEEEKAYIWAGKREEEQCCRDPEVLRRFFEVWTAKEAYFKKCGTGITDLKSVNVLPLQRQTHFIGDYILQIL